MQLNGLKLIWLTLNKEGKIESLNTFYEDETDPVIITEPAELNNIWRALKELGVVQENGNKTKNNKGMATEKA